MRPILFGSLALSSVVMSAMFAKPTWLDDSQRWIHNLTSDQAEFRPIGACRARIEALRLDLWTSKDAPRLVDRPF